MLTYSDADDAHRFYSSDTYEDGYKKGINECINLLFVTGEINSSDLLLLFRDGDINPEYIKKAKKMNIRKRV